MSRHVSTVRDPQQRLVAAKRRLANAPVQLADGFARLVRRSPPEGIERVMRTPVRRAVLDAIFWQMPQHFDRARAGGVNATVEWRITGRSDGGFDTYQVTVSDGRCRASRGAKLASPTVTITVDAAEFLKLATGNADPIQGYFKGHVKLAGDVMLAARLQQLFRIPTARPPRSQST
jgi:putative sterol carrier protein